MCIERSNLLHCDCLPVFMLLYMILSNLMLFISLFNAVCLYNACLFLFAYFSIFCIVIYANDFLCFIFRLVTNFFFFQLVICIVYSAFNQFVFLILCSHYFFYGDVLSGEIALIDNQFYLLLLSAKSA